MRINYKLFGDNTPIVCKLPVPIRIQYLYIFILEDLSGSCSRRGSPIVTNPSLADGGGNKHMDLAAKFA